MSGARLASLLVSGAVLPEREVARAQRRRALYGGSLDTVLLELGALDEPALTARLAEATGLPAAAPERLAAPDPRAATWMPIEEARRLRAAPLGRDGERIEVAVHPDAASEPIGAWAAGQGATAVRLVVPEVRLRELLAVLYGEPVPPRHGALLGKMMGAERVRRRLDVRGAIPPPVVDTGPRPGASRPQPPPPAAEPDIEIIEETPAPARVEATATRTPAAGVAISMPVSPAAAPQRRETLRGQAALTAAIDSGDAKRQIPALIEKLGDRNPQVVAAAQAALVNLARQDFGTSRRGWSGWWSKNRQRHRAEWLLEALGHKRADLRLAASQELQALTGVYFGYHFDLPERDREEARRRWTDWWHSVGKGRLGKERE